MSAGRPSRHRARNAASVASPRKRRWAPSCQPAPGAIPLASRSTAASASSRSNRSGRARFSRWSKRVSRSWRSASEKPLSVRSRSAVARRSISRRASRSASHSPPIRFSATLSRRASSTGRSSRITGTVVRPARRAATSRWWPAMTRRSARRASTGSTTQNVAMERVRAASSSSPMRRGLPGSGCRSAIGSSSTCRGEVVVGTASALVAVMGTPPSGAGSRGRAAGGGGADRPTGPRITKPSASSCLTSAEMLTPIASAAR